MLKTIARTILSVTPYVGFMTLPAHAEMVPKWELGIGVGGFSMPDYRGSDQTRSYLLPVPYVIYRLDWLKVDRTGLRSKLFDSDKVEFNLSMSATPPVYSSKNRAREGMHDIKPTIEIGGSLDTHLWKSGGDRVKLDLRLPVRAAFTVESSTHQVGVIFSPRLNVDIAEVGGKPWHVGMLAGPIFATRRQHEYLYGVPAEDARPDRPAYSARAGYAGTQFLVSLSRRFEKLWIGAYARYDDLHGAVFDDSPLFRRSSYSSVGFAVSWALSQSSTMVQRDDD